MHFFNAKTVWVNKKFVPFKLCIASIYVITGSNFRRNDENYYLLLFILLGISAVWMVTLWLKKMRR